LEVGWVEQAAGHTIKFNTLLARILGEMVSREDLKAALRDISS